MSTEDDWLLTPSRVAVHRPTATAVLSDLHLGYAEARRRGGDAVPTIDLAEALAPLASTLDRHGVSRLVIAGDLFEAGFREDLSTQLLAWLKEKGVELLPVVPGNHDRGLSRTRGGLPVCAGPLVLGGWHIVHGDGPLPAAPVVQGHLHPCLRIRAQRLSVPCYLTGERRLILPAYTVEAAGVNVFDHPEWDDLSCHVIVGDQVLDFGDLASLRQRTAGRRRQ